MSSLLFLHRRYFTLLPIGQKFLSHSWIFKSGVFSAWLLISVLAGCGGGSGGGDALNIDETGDIDVESTVDLVGLQLSPQLIKVVVGTQVQVSATAIFSDNSKIDVTQQVNWSTSISSIATVGDSVATKGLVQAVSEGVATLSAQYQTVQVSANIVVSNAQLLGLKITPANYQLAVGDSVSIKATANFDNNTSQDVTSLVNWQTTNALVAGVGNGGEAGGVVTANSVGQSSITATYGNLLATSAIKVSDAVLTEISITPAVITLAAGTEIELSATGHYSDSSVRDITNLAQWFISNDQIARLDTVNGDKLILHALLAGETSLSITAASITSVVNVSVTQATLNSLSIIPASSTLASGSTTQLSAIGTFSDFSTQNLTEQVTWVSSDSAILTVANALGLAGKVTAVSPGKVGISAQYQNIQATSTLVVTDAELVSVNVTPLNSVIAAGTQLLMVASGNYSDGTSLDLTDKVKWDSTEKSTANFISDGNNVLTALSPGSTTVAAVIDGVVGSVRVDVTDAILESIAIFPPQVTLAKGTSLQLQALGTFSDASVQDITHQVSWESADGAVAVVSNDSNLAGNVQSLTTGSTILSAKLISDSSIQATATLNVSDAVLQSITITPDVAQISNNTKLQFVATGHYSDSTTQDLTQQVTWTSSNNALAVISNASDSKGLVEGVSSDTTGAGSVVIKAIFVGGETTIEQSSSLNIDYIADKPVALVARASPNIILNDGVDTTSIEVQVKAAAANVNVPDGTLVDFNVLQGSAILSSSSATTINGAAQIQLTTSSEGLIIVRASVRDTEISNYALVIGTASFTNAFARFAILSAQTEANEVLADSRFIFFILNISNRVFDVTGFQFKINDEIRYEETRLVSVSGSQIVYSQIILSNNVAASSYTSEFLVTEPLSLQNFILTAQYNVIFE